MEKTANKIVVQGKMLTMHEVHGWCIQEPFTTRTSTNDKCIRSAADFLQPFIGKEIKITVEVVE